MRLTRRSFLQLPLIAGVSLVANKALAIVAQPVNMGEFVEVERFYRKIDGTERNKKILEMFISKEPDFSDDPEAIIINVDSFSNKQELADAIDVLQRFVVEDQIQSKRKGKDYQQRYEIVVSKGQYIENSTYYERLDIEVDAMVDKMNLDCHVLFKEEGGNYPSFGTEGIIDGKEPYKYLSQLDYSDISEDAAHEKKVQKIMERQRERSLLARLRARL